MAVTPQTPKCHYNRGAAEVMVTFGSLVCGVTNITENRVPNLFYHGSKNNFKLGNVVKPNCLSAVQV